MNHPKIAEIKELDMTDPDIIYSKGVVQEIIDQVAKQIMIELINKAKAIHAKGIEIVPAGEKVDAVSDNSKRIELFKLMTQHNMIEEIIKDIIKPKLMNAEENL